MRPFLFGLVTLLAVAALAPAAPVPKGVKKKVNDAERLVGTWKPVEGRTEWFEFTADGGMKAWTTGGSAKSGVPYTWTVAPDAEPKRMTWGDTSADRRPQWECVYELDGDRLRITYARAGGPPPGAVKAGDGLFYCDLVRDTPAR